MNKKAIIIGAGPAGLTAAYELLQRTDIVPIILEKSGDIGGISKTVNYKGNRIDIGGHRFFSKSDRVMQWWLNIMPIQPMEEKKLTVTYQRHTRTIKTEETFSRYSEQAMPDKVMLVRKRLSRIYFLRKFFTYPIQLSLDTLRKLGLGRTIGILVSYLKARIFPRKPEKNLEEFFINRFGDKLYRLFFKDYTEKVWGVPCTKISAEWGAQRIKGISIGKAIAHALQSMKPKARNGKADAENDTDISQKGTETSLIEKFLYPKFGPGQLWEEVARQVRTMGGEILMHQEVKTIITEGHSVTAIGTTNAQTGETNLFEGDYFFSTMPVQELISGMKDTVSGKEVVPENVREIAAGLQYRDFITVGVLLAKMPQILPDTWIYIQEKDVKVGRLQIFNNWSPYMVKDPNTVWVGMEYFCNKEDEFWNLTDDEIQSVAIGELEKMGLACVEDVLDATALRMEKTYPAYFGSYNRFEEIRAFTDGLENLFLVGRNGMHKYNNSDHSMLTAMVAVDNIAAGITEKANIWAINTEQEYHEQKTENRSPAAPPTSAPPLQTQPQLAFIPPQGPGSFKNFLLKDRWNRTILLLAGIAIVIQFVIFKCLYPRAGFISADSYVYLQTAFLNVDINTYPIGYSRFLRLLSVFTNSDTALVAFQYLFIQCSALLFLFTLFFFYRPGKFVRIVLLTFVLFNPVWLYLSNYVSSDPFFLALSLLWFTLLLWILERPRLHLVIAQVIVLFLAFTVRYNALYYPLITAMALLLYRRRTGGQGISTGIRLAGIAASFLVIAGFMWYTAAKYRELSGIRQFSPFSGWQLANNAMYAYRYVDSADVKPAPARFRELDRAVRTYFDTTRDWHKHPTEMLLANTYYMWDSLTPLQQYMNRQFKKDSTSKKLKKWATVGPLYADYGAYLIRQYPLVFAKYYLWPNALKYYAPPVEFLDSYNMGRDTIAPIAQQWFGYKSNKTKTAFKDLKVSILNFYPILAGILNVLFLFSFLFFGMLHGFRENRTLSATLVLVGSFWLVNFGFSVFASPIALRFQLFPMLVFFSFSLLLMEYIYKAAFIPSDTKPRTAPTMIRQTKLA